MEDVGDVGGSLGWLILESSTKRYDTTMNLSSSLVLDSIHWQSSKHHCQRGFPDCLTWLKNWHQAAYFSPHRRKLSATRESRHVSNSTCFHWLSIGPAAGPCDHSIYSHIIEANSRTVSITIFKKNKQEYFKSKKNVSSYATPYVQGSLGKKQTADSVIEKTKHDIHWKTLSESILEPKIQQLHVSQKATPLYAQISCQT